ncbi:LysM peptidoglycan-binding domain-containing protein [Listeria seeligeri]|uniref:GH25 family lysozyme n=1 Tax=Listeria seeligeri TaxID=1640 RepID=UPI0016268EDE|nr:GH25 family lysozyme [Listeria seeligeri]MBC1850182.1 LysM peptidoglycan-binding domain-containing protein [Listeria seeligeri]MBC1850256.1 LysM peptidoglycan-binding domain-containing protein [Listeria seeligeri]MBF2533449.1 LysM peptidoglycan-binding domain-containing protein [Listeria seeligeri]HAO6121915.1 LysM peptidoglycan-binding domain-containing protein [Listeria monocytogenes]
MAKILDVSHHQSPNSFDWNKLKNEIDGIIIRVQYGSNLVDKQYKNFIAKAKQYKIPFGLYAYGVFVSVADAKVEAKDFLKRGDSAAKFWVLDVESDTIESCGAKNLSSASQAFIDTLKAAGKKTGFYYEHRYIGKYGLDNVKADFRWMPRYGTNDGRKQTNYKPAISCDLWQYTSAGTAGGAKPLDLSDLNGNKKLDWFFGANSKPAIAPKPTPKPAPKKPEAIKTTSMYVNTAHLNIREKASANSRILGVLNKNDRVQVISSAGGWSKLKSGSKTVFVSSKYLSKSKVVAKPVKTTKQYYTIKSGDNLSSIAKKYKTTVKQLQAWNNIKNANKIFAGQKIRIK